MIYIIILIIIVSSVLTCLNFYSKYKHIKENYELYKEYVNQKYIFVDVRVRNAILEAYESAKKDNRKFEAQIFEQLVKEIKRRS